MQWNKQNKRKTEKQISKQQNKITQNKTRTPEGCQGKKQIESTYTKKNPSIVISHLR